jgi:hypothetical protein
MRPGAAPAAEQSQHGITKPPGDADDLGGMGVPLGPVTRSGDGVAQGGQAGREGRVVARRSGQPHRFGGQFQPSRLGDDQRRGDREPGRDQRGQHGVGLGQGIPGLLEQTDLLAVEQLDLEPGRAAAQAEGGPGEQVGAPGPAVPGPARTRW